MRATRNQSGVMGGFLLFRVLARFRGFGGGVSGGVGLGIGHGTLYSKERARWLNE